MKAVSKIAFFSLLAALPPSVRATGDASQKPANPSASTNSIAFCESRGDRSANLVLSTLELAMMDPVERENLLASLETQFGKPKVWASRAARATSESVFGFARDGQKEKYGVRLRARQVMPVFSPDLSQVAPAEKAPVASGELAPANLLGVRRSEVLTWTPSQDNYLGDGNGADRFAYNSNNKWMNPGFNYKLGFDPANLGDFYTPTFWGGFQIKLKTQADLAGRFEYNQWWYKAWRAGLDRGWTRDVTGGASVGARYNIQGVIAWGHDWNLWWAGTWGFGAEAVLSIGLWPSVNVGMNSSNTRAEADRLSVNATFGPYVEAQGNVWVGKTEHKDSDDDIFYSDSHKLVGGVKGQIVFQGNLSIGAGYTCEERDWYNDKWNNAMTHIGKLGNTSASGKLVARAEIKFWNWTIQNGWQIWAGAKYNNGWTERWNYNNTRGLDSLL
jgi:hypothetical protein